ncbi:MAG TPA: hypothetical protein VHM90_02200 [Phycisphaerae bacterium]|jgi:hypothetical protein|nr:hypothetical protein [Phycisphaerae bacterium]
MVRRWLIRLFYFGLATVWLGVLMGSFWWAAIAIVAVIVLILAVLHVIQSLENIRGRQVFYAKGCPACQKGYERLDVRQAKHLLKTKVIGGPPPAPFSAQFYEAWELRCRACGHVQDFDSRGDAIIFEQEEIDEGASPTE